MVDYWKKQDDNQPFGINLIQRVMKQYIFHEIMACIDGDVRFIFLKIDKQMKSLWQPSQNICLDESCIKNKSRWNPHHIYIPRKPGNRKNNIKVLFFFFFLKKKHTF